MPDGPLIAGIDAGTTRIRALVLEPDGTPVAEGSRPTPVRHPHPGWGEHDADALWEAAAAALRDATTELDDPDRIQGIAVGSVGEAGVLLDGGGAALHPVIAWYDTRTQDVLERLIDRIGWERLFATTGLCPDPTFSLCKLVWLKENAPEAFVRAARWLHVSDYLSWKLSGIGATSYSLGSRTMALDLAKAQWSEELLEAAGIPVHLLQPLTPAGAAIGAVTVEAAEATGLPPGCAVGMGGHDHVCGAIGMGAIGAGLLLDSIGTAEALTLGIERPLTDPEVGRQGFNQGVIAFDGPGYYVFGGLPTAAGSVEWFRTALGGEVDYETLIAEAEAVPPGSLGVLFLPHLRIGSPPFPDPVGRGAFLGLSTDATRGTLFRAVLEGIAFDAANVLRTMKALPGVSEIAQIKVVGGSTRNDLLMRIKASVYGRPIEVAEMPEATSVGAALLGGLAGGVYPDIATAVGSVKHCWRTVEPVPAWQELYRERFERVYADTYAALRPVHRALR